MAVERHLTNPNPPAWRIGSLYFVSQVARRLGLAPRVLLVGETADFVSWGKKRFPDFRVRITREKVWESMVETLGHEKVVRGIELGVAWGYATQWWLGRMPDERLRWDGFDRFCGLPRAWRSHEVGAFDAHGRPPAIEDPRVTWHVGDVEDRIHDLNLTRTPDEVLVVLFDLDLLEPSLYAWNALKKHLRAGDVLYFDEAFDWDERHLLDNHVLPAGEYRCIAASPWALALQVVSMSSNQAEV